jgi:hypothetical protein
MPIHQMRIRDALLLCGLVAVIAALAFSGGARARSASKPRVSTTANSQHLQVTEVEYRLILSRGVVKAGPLDLKAIDGGMDPHDLRLRHVDAEQEIASPELTPGRRWNGVVNLKPGIYDLWCSLPEHATLGMHATLRVLP